MPPFHVFQRNSVVKTPGGGPPCSAVHSSGTLPSRLPPLEGSGEHPSVGSVHSVASRSLLPAQERKAHLSQGPRSGRSSHGLPSSRETSPSPSSSTSHLQTTHRTEIHPVRNAVHQRAISSDRHDTTTTTTTQWSGSVPHTYPTASSGTTSAVTSASPFSHAVPTPPPPSICRSTSPALSTTPARTTATLHPEEEAEVWTLKALVANTSNRMNHLKDVTPSVDVSQILSISSLPGSPWKEKKPEESSKRYTHTFPKEGRETASGGTAAAPTTISTATTSQRILPLSKETAASSGPTTTKSSSSNPSAFIFGVTPLSTAERARRAAAAEWKKIAHRNARKKAASSARSSSTSSGAHLPPTITDEDEDEDDDRYEPVEIEEEYDLEEVLQSLPSAPSFNVDGSRYFIDRLMRGPETGASTAAGGRRRKKPPHATGTTKPRGERQKGGGTDGVGTTPTSSHPTGKSTRIEEDEEDEEEDAEVAALYRKLHDQERRLGDRFQALRQRWLQRGKGEGEEVNLFEEREDGREEEEEEEGGGNGWGMDREGGGRKKAEGGRESVRKSAPFLSTRRTVFPTIPPAEPSVFSAVTEDEIREKAAAAEEFVKNHINRRHRQKQLEVAERHRKRRQERRKQEEMEQQQQQKKKKEEEEERRKAEEAKASSSPWKASSGSPRTEKSVGAALSGGASGQGGASASLSLEKEDHEAEEAEAEDLLTTTSSRDTSEETQTSHDTHRRSDDSSAHCSARSESRQSTTTPSAGETAPLSPTGGPDHGADDRLKDGDAEKREDGKKDSAGDAGGKPSAHRSKKHTKRGTSVGLEGEKKELLRDIPPRKLNPQLAGDNIKEAMWGMTSSSTASPRPTVAVEAIIGMLENRADVVLPSPSETTLISRRGDVLSGTFILKLDLQDALRDRTGPMGMIAGAPYFRIVPKFNIAGVAQATASAVKTILNELRRAHIESPIIWVNLRDEPLVYIHNNAYIVRERARPLEAIIIPNATGRSIEMVERKLKCEVLAEAFANGGNVSVWAEGKDGVVEDQWVSASQQSVFTTQEVFESISCSTYGRSQLQYYRWPITQNVGPQPEHFDFVLEACLEEPKAVFIFNCQTGRGRTSTMMQIANIVRFYQFCVKDVAVDGRLLRTASHGPKFKTIQQLISLLPDGKLHHCRIFTLMDLADKVYSMADHIADAFEEQEKNPEVAMMRLQQCAYFLVFSFYCEQRLWNFQTKDSFADWLEANSEIKRLILGIREKLSDQLKDERIGEEVPSDMDGKTLHIIRHRAGNVLSSGRVLCHMAMQKENVPKGLRQLGPGVPLFSCGRTSEVGVMKLFHDIQKEFPNYRTIHLLSVRAEPYVVINDVEYIICDVTTQPGVTDVGTSMHVSLKAMEQLEDRLRRDVLLESQESKGSILLHKLNAQGERKALFVKVINAKTPKTVMEDFSQKSGAQYIRIPVPFVDHIITSDVDPLLRYLSESECHKQDVFVIYDSDGGTRTSLVMNILTLYRASRFASLRSIQSCKDVIQVLKAKETELLMPMAARSMNEHTSNCTSVPERRVEVLLASTVCQMLTAGSLLRTVESVIELGGVGKDWNILHYVDYLKLQIGGTGRSKPQCLQKALRGLRSYLEVLLVSVYLDHNGDFTPDMPFNTWVSMRKEVFNILTRLDGRGENALTYVNAENLMKADVSRRCGDVLTANFCLKADHFPGCQKQGLRPALCGAPNFRKVDLVNVYGVAITTLVGLHNVLSLLGASEEPMLTYPGQRNDSELYLGFAAPRLFDPTFKPEELRRPLRGSCLWINLREEPILYVGDRPFVFRDLAAPYVNVELTGIETKKIENVEQQLKIDVLNEADMYNGKFLVHDEAKPGELVGMWEDASEDTVKTTREVYNEVVDKGYRCMMLRLPVTDEQSPEIRDFDLMVDALLPSIAAHMDRRETLSFVFNCQMGRGRTTTGMVICCLLIGLVIPEYFSELHNCYYAALNDKSLSEMGKGNYAIVNQLRRVLMNGRKAKDRVDLVLEACSKMQNLRTAIEGLALVQQSPDFTESQRARAHHAGVHYLVRYFNLIVFAVYLEEEYNRMQKQMRCTFEEWMLEHPEISTIAEKASLT